MYVTNELFYSHICQRLAVEILVSGFVFDVEDFVRPWEGQNGNLERYKHYSPPMFEKAENYISYDFICSIQPP